MLKKFSKIIIFIVILIILWAVILAMNIVKCINYEPPLSFFSIGGLHDNSGGTSEFIGYSIRYYPCYRDQERKMYHTELTAFNTKLFETPPIQTNRKLENAKIEVQKDSITENNITIVITDTNEFSYGWYGDYEIEDYDTWRRIKIDNNFMIDEILPRDENNQITIDLDISEIYDQLPSGTYRIVKEVYDKSHSFMYIRSNEFEIVK